MMDGRDKIVSSRSLSIARSAWGDPPGPVLADAAEVLDKSSLGKDYRVPIGENTPNSFSMFERTELFVMAFDDNTSVQIDADANGSFEITRNLNQGENYRVAGGVKQGAHVLASKTVQVHVLTGDIGSNYESRWFTMFPTEQWSSKYYNPVATTSKNAEASVYFFNPGASSINITPTVVSGTVSPISVPAGGTGKYTIPLNSGAMFTSNANNPFFAVLAMDSDDKRTSTNDWG
jgi:hypothetical protein